MNRWKGLFLIAGAFLAAVITAVVTPPRIAHGAASSPVLVTNTVAAPVLTQEASQLPAEAIGLVCRAGGEAKTLTCEELPYNPTSPTAIFLSPYFVPPSKVFIVTELEVHDGSGVGVNLACSSTPSMTYGLWQDATTGTAQYLIPNGIPLPAGCGPTMTLSKAASALEVFLRGYITSGNGAA